MEFTGTSDLGFFGLTLTSKVFTQKRSEGFMIGDKELDRFSRITVVILFIYLVLFSCLVTLSDTSQVYQL